jgi:GNAT superfamily N-acetyltransferase
MTGRTPAPVRRLTFVRDPRFDAALRAGLARLWNDVNNAGGAVGFVPPTTVEDVLPDLDEHAQGIAAGRVRLVVGLDGAADRVGASAAGPAADSVAGPAADRVGASAADPAGEAVGRPVAAAFLGLNAHRLMRHWGWLHTVMVDPALHRTGAGSELVREAVRLGRDLGLEGLRLSYRDGLGLGRFYGSLGFREIGRVPGGLRIGAAGDRDSVEMWLPLV